MTIEPSTLNVRKLWRYAVETDFHAIDPSVDTEERVMSYGTEERFIPFDHPIEKSWFTHSLNADQTLLALPDKMNIDVYNLDSGARTVLVGHTTDVLAFQFSPTDPDILVSCSQPEEQPNGEESEHNDIIIWNVRQMASQPDVETPRMLDRVAGEGVQAIIAGLGDALILADEDSTEMRNILQTMLKRLHTRAQIPASTRLDGLIKTNFGSRVFSNSGDYVIFQPAVRGYTNGNWADICIYHIPTRITTTLTGHRDAIMWTGFSPDDTLIASAGWDGTFRVHDVTGKRIWKWETGRQNWTAAFSPDEDRGRLALYAVSDGKLDLAQERKLSIEKCDVESLEPRLRNSLVGFLGVHTAQFLNSSSGQLPTTRLVSSVSIDEGIEVFDFDKGKKRRFVPEYDQDGSPLRTKAGDGHIGLVGHIWRKDKGEIGVLAPDGVRIWHLD